MTTATLTGRVTRVSEEVRAESSRLDPATVLLTVLMVIPFVVGWSAGMVWRAAWASFAWTYGALVVGWRSAAGRPDEVEPR